jgi:MoxR-like ATPase
MEMAVKERIKALLDQLNTGIYEKEEVMALALLSSIAGESIFLLGPPGVAKSLIARRLKCAYKDAKVFEYLMSRFSTPDEIFGPVAISKLKVDKYERIIENYLPSADVVFLDEIWKAGPSIQNALLTILNEKIFRNGEKVDPVPMKALISASNELPAKDQGLEALWDRFLVRLIVGGIEDGEKFDAMIGMSSDPFKEIEKSIDGSITGDEYKKWDTEIGKINIPKNVFNVIHVIRKKIELHNKNKENVEKQIYVSDRRWRKIVRVMRTSAFVNDRSEVDLMDCFLIKHCIWDEEDKIQTVSGFVNQAIRDYGPNLDMNLYTEREEFNKLKAEIEKNTSKKIGEKPKQYPNSNKTILYYRLAKPIKNEYYLVESSIVDKATDNTTKITVYSDKDNKDTISWYIKKDTNKNSILLSDSSYSDWETCQLETEPIIKPYKKSPTRGDYKIWNDETNRLSSVLGEKKTETSRFWDTFSESFYGNIFVDRSNADGFIKSKIDAVVKEIDNFMINIDAICKNYRDIYKPNESQI